MLLNDLLTNPLANPLTQYAEKRFVELKRLYFGNHEYVPPVIALISANDDFELGLEYADNTAFAVDIATYLLGKSKDLDNIPLYAATSLTAFGDDFWTSFTLTSGPCEFQIDVSEYFSDHDDNGDNAIRNVLFLFKCAGFFCAMLANKNGAGLTLFNSENFIEYKWATKVNPPTPRGFPGLAANSGFSRMSAATITTTAAPLEVTLKSSLMGNLQHLRDTLDTETVAPQVVYPRFYRYDPHAQVNRLLYPLENVERKVLELICGVGTDIGNTPYEGTMGMLFFAIYQAIYDLSYTQTPEAEAIVISALDKLDTYLNDKYNQANPIHPKAV